MKWNLACRHDHPTAALKLVSQPTSLTASDLLWQDWSRLEEMVPAASVERIDVDNVLHTLSWRVIDAVLITLAGKLQPGGTLHIRVPDHEAVCQSLLADPDRAQRWQEQLYGDQRDTDAQTRSLWTEKLMNQRLLMAGLIVQSMEQEAGWLHAWGQRPQ